VSVLRSQAEKKKTPEQEGSAGSAADLGYRKKSKHRRRNGSIAAKNAYDAKGKREKELGKAGKTKAARLTGHQTRFRKKPGHGITRRGKEKNWGHGNATHS